MLIHVAVIDTTALLAEIYEAGAMPERWPTTLESIARSVGALGGNLINKRDDEIVLVSSPSTIELTADFKREGWNSQNSRVERLLSRVPYAGFLTDSDLHTDEELGSMPMYTEFLTPRGAAAGAATIVQGAGGEGLILAIEAFPDHEASRRMAPMLDTLRPHLARAAALSATIQSNQRGAIVQTLHAMDVPAAFIDEAGGLRESNPSFAAALEKDFSDHPGRMRLRDAKADAEYVRALGKLRRLKQGSSIALRDDDGVGQAVLHLVPIAGDARDMFSNVTTIAIVAGIANRSLPHASMLAALFDLTPIEADVARLIAGGRAPAEIAKMTGKSVTTVRFHLKQIFLKTGTHRQAGLAVLLSGLAAPVGL